MHRLIDALPVCSGQNLLHLAFEPYLSSEANSRKYEILPNVLSMHVKIKQKKNEC